VLDDFAATKLDSSAPQPTLSSPSQPPIESPIPATLPFTDPNAPLPPAGLDEDAFARELQAGMSDLLGELDSSPEMQKQFEEMLRELGASAASGGAPPNIPGLAGLGTATGAPSEGVRDAGSEAGGLSFQESIRKTMERMQASGEAAGQAATEAGENDMMAQLLKEFESGGLGGGGDEDFSKILMGMMEQLTNKEILYEPMKELDTKFPEWMEKNGSKTNAADMQRYQTQQRLVKEIVSKFEVPDYTDENVEYRQYIVDRMQQVSFGHELTL
jgi:peroxin-19